MSPDDIFAAQFWPWPDPAIKRDSQGRVLFVNAAFLQLYGGTVQDWTGNVVGGWPSPQGPGQPYRFETRMPMTGDVEEQVYDWMEMTLADGHAFALARNVTLFMQPADPKPSVDAPVQVMADHTSTQVLEQQMPEQMALATQADNYVTADLASSAHQDMSLQMQDVPAATEAVVAPTHEPVVFAEYTPEPEVLTQAPQTPQAHVDAPAAEVAEPQTQVPMAEASDIPTETDSASGRSYERRALPIENESAVLGNNWRDAVIAKAVGADAIPAAPAATEQPVVADADHTETNVGPKRILLAEDNAINALLTRTLLEVEGHIVETVEDGQLAVDAMKTSVYDLIFMDMRMPNMDGLEATRKIRTLPNVRKDLPIIALTANAFDDDRNACFDSGMNDFMTKPVSAEELSEMVAEWTTPKEQRMAS